MKKVLLIMSVATALVLSFTFCSKDDDAPDYVGEWQTDLYPMPGDTTGAIENRTIFNFSEETFKAQINTKTSGVEIPTLGIKGTIEDIGDKTLDVSLTDAGTYNGTDFDYKSRVDDAAEFEAIYQGYLSNALPKDFDADYMVDGNKMEMYVPGDTIFLSKK